MELVDIHIFALKYFDTCKQHFLPKINRIQANMLLIKNERFEGANIKQILLRDNFYCFNKR